MYVYTHNIYVTTKNSSNNVNDKNGNSNSNERKG